MKNKKSLLEGFVVLFLIVATFFFLGNAIADEYDRDEDRKDSYDENKKDSYDEDKKDDYDEDKNDSYDQDKKDDYDAYEEDKRDSYDKSGKDEYQKATQYLKNNNEYDEYSKEKEAYDEYFAENSTKETINNDDGTVTIRFTKTDDDEVEIRETTYDSEGNVIMEKKIEREEGEEEVKITTFNVFGKKIGEYKMETKDGKSIEIKTDITGSGKYKLEFDVTNEKLEIRDTNRFGPESKVSIRNKGDYFQISHSGVTANASFPMIVDDSTGKILIRTSYGDVELNAMPSTIVESVKGAQALDVVEKVEIQENDGLKYVVEGLKYEKLFGMFNIKIPLELELDASTGELGDVNRSFFAATLDIFSF